MFCLANDIEIVLLCETWFDETIRNAELSFDKLYQVFRYDRESRGGGVCILVRRYLNVIQIIPNLTGEYISLEFSTLSESFRIVCVYVPAFGLSTDKCDRVRKICWVISFVRSFSIPCVVIGDFNLPRIKWHAMNFSDGESAETIFVETCDELNFFQLIDEPPHKAGHILDLLLTTDPDLVNNILL